MNLTVTTIAKSLADYLAPCFPSVAFYEDPNQQGSRTPCMFLQTRYNYLTLETGGFWRRRLGLDLTYLAVSYTHLPARRCIRRENWGWKVNRSGQ